jgi:hypothetical protein
MIPTYLSLAGWTRPDLIFKIVVNIAAVIGFLLLAHAIRARRSESESQTT